MSGKGFTGPSDFKALAKKTTNYPLVFRPQWKGNYSGTLTLSNYPMGEYVFNLRGVGEEPLAEDNITVECVAKTKTAVRLNVKSISR
jgi:hypothetical protein